MTIIAMTRESGTRGSEIAAALADQLHLEVIHDERVEHDIANRIGIPESDVHHYLQEDISLFERLTFKHRAFSKYTALEILELAAKGNVLIRGWGATRLLNTVPHVLCVRVCAPMSYREAVLLDRGRVESPADARREIEHSDAIRHVALQKQHKSDWQDPLHYALVLNTGRVPVADCVDQIIRLAQSEAFTETPYSRDLLMDQLILARVQFALDQRFGPKSLQNGIEPRVIGGNVLLIGGTTDEQMIVDAVRLVQKVEGVRGVESKVAHVAFYPHG
jgi:cytidylate kinase